MHDTRQMISKIPVFHMWELDGKQLTMRVDQIVDREYGCIDIILTGEDEKGRQYVLAHTTERL